MEKKFTILVTLMFILSAMVPFALSVTTETFEDGVYITTEYLDESDEEYFGDEDEYYVDADFIEGGFGWTHIIDPECKNILLVTLNIGAWDVDCGPEFWNMDEVFADGESLGFLTGDNDVFSISTFTINPEYLADGEIEIWLDIDTNDIDSKVMIEDSELIVEWVPCLKVEKTIVDAEYGTDPYYCVPIFTNAWWDLEITVQNPDSAENDDALTGIWVYDGIGAKLDLVIQDPTPDDPNSGDEYIFKIDGVEQLLAGDDNQYYGDESGSVEWYQANGKHAPAKNPCATNVWWYIGDLDDGAPATTLQFRVETIEFTRGNNNKHTKQAFTSTCHHPLNDGPMGSYYFEGIKYYSFGDPVEVSVYDPTEGVDTDGDGYYDVDEVETWGTDPCDPESHPILVSGFNSVRGRAPLGSGDAESLEEELLDADNFGFGGTVPCPIELLDFVETIETESLVDGDDNLLVDVFFAGLTATDLTTDEADELKAFLEAGGILYISGNSGANEGPSYNPLFTALGWSDSYTTTHTGLNGDLTSTPVSTPITTGPFGTCGPLTSTPFRHISTSTATNVATGVNPSYCIIAEASVGSNGGYLSMTGDPLYFDLFVDTGGTYYDGDNLIYFLNLFALAS